MYFYAKALRFVLIQLSWCFMSLSLTVYQDPTELDQITTLPNGVRVATEALPGHFSGIGVYVDAGSRYENEELRGVSHIVDRLAFKVRTLFNPPRSPMLTVEYSLLLRGRQTKCSNL